MNNGSDNSLEQRCISLNYRAKDREVISLGYSFQFLEYKL